MSEREPSPVLLMVREALTTKLLSEKQTVIKAFADAGRYREYHILSPLPEGGGKREVDLSVALEHVRLTSLYAPVFETIRKRHIGKKAHIYTPAFKEAQVDMDRYETAVLNDPELKYSDNPRFKAVEIFVEDVFSTSIQASRIRAERRSQSSK